MIWMHVRADHPFNGFTCHEAVKQAFPLRFGGIEVEAGVDNGPTIAIFEQPQINVIEGSGHGKPHPPDPWSHLKRLVARVLQSAPRIHEPAVLFIDTLQ